MRFLTILITKSDRLMFRFDGEFPPHSAGSSDYSHRWTYGLGNYMGQALTTGCDHEDAKPNCAQKTELMNMSTLKYPD